MKVPIPSQKAIVHMYLAKSLHAEKHEKSIEALLC